MLRKNKFSVVIMSLLLMLILSSCGGVYVPSTTCGYAFKISPDSENDIQSDIIKTREIMLNDKPYTYIYNVAYSLRNDNDPNKIIKKYITPNDYSNNFAGAFFTTDRNVAKKYDYIYFEDEEEFYKEQNAQQNNTSKYYIIINDPDLDGYDSNYETVKKYLHNSEDKTIYLGAKN